MQVRDLFTAHGGDPARFRQAVGPWVLLQRPPAPVYAQLAGLLRRGETVGMAHEARLPQEILGMLKSFEHLLAWPLSGLDSKGELVIGRAPDCDVVIQEPSVSSRHAKVRQGDKGESCILTDLDSRNGTFVNARRIEEQSSVLFDGDALSFGDAQFLFLKAESFAAHLTGYRERLGEAARAAR